MYDAFYPGRVWLDTEGKRIQAHGGSVIYVDGTWYWYGENKEFTDGRNGIWTWGVRCYASRDLYNWEDKGLIIQPDTEDPESSLNPRTSMMDRPHILYNRKTKKYVCWMKIMHEGGYQTETVCTADNFLGPYKIVNDRLNPLGMNGGDFDLAVADDGKAYYYFERVHGELICADLNEEYTDVTGYYSTHFPYAMPPFCREAPCHFRRKGKHYLITSGTTWYLPNPSMAAISDTWHGPYVIQGNPHVGDASNTSFHSQISCIFQVPGKKDLYIACADRWLPEAMDLQYEDYAEKVRRMYDPEEEFDPSAPENRLPVENTSIADYVWLPLRFEGEKVFIDWKDRWRVEDFEDADEPKSLSGTRTTAPMSFL